LFLIYSRMNLAFTKWNTEIDAVREQTGAGHGRNSGRMRQRQCKPRLNPNDYVTSITSPGGDAHPSPERIDHRVLDETLRWVLHPHADDRGVIGHVEFSECCCYKSGLIHDQTHYLFVRHIYSNTL
jgi:hypothetical protein